MIASLIRNRISSVIATPGYDSIARQRLRELSNGSSGDPAREDRLIELLREYVERAPDLLDACHAAAQRAGVAAEAAPILHAAANYFLEPQDFIPDRMGLFGLLDDAYLAHRFVAAASDLYRQYAGIPLLDLDLASMNAVARSVIGEPLASQLDQVADATVQSVVQQIQFLATQRPQFAFSPTGGPGAWGGTWEDEMARTGAELGISINW